MRCPSCGTLNEPDSRFCGGCGARLGGTLAPTHKVVTGGQPVAAPPAPAMPSSPGVAQRTPSAERQVASQPQPYPMAPSVERRPSGAPQSRGPSAPQPSQRSGPQSSPRSGNGAPASSFQTTTPQPRPSVDASGSMPIAQPRRIGLIVFVLLLDIGLATAGAWMLSEGLSSSEKPGVTPAPTPGSAAKTGSVPAPPPDPIAAPVPAVVPPPVVQPPDTGSGSAATVVRDSSASGSAMDAAAQNKQPKKRKKKKLDGAKPIDPYGDPTTPPPPPLEENIPPPPS